MAKHNFSPDGKKQLGLYKFTHYSDKKKLTKKEKVILFELEIKMIEIKNLISFSLAMTDKKMSNRIDEKLQTIIEEERFE